MPLLTELGIWLLL